MNQSFSWAAFMAGLVTFLGITSEMFSQHRTWAELYESPMGAAHLVTLGASFVSCIVGALGVQLPRNPANYGERKDDPPALPPQPPAPIPVVVVAPEPVHLEKPPT